MQFKKSYPFLTIVIPVYNEEKFIEQTLRQLLVQEYPTDRFEILVVDGLSIDGTRKIVKDLMLEYPPIHLLDNPNRKSSSGRNIGFKKGRGDYFLVIDGHCYIPDSMLLQNIVEAFRKSGADCLGRPQPLDPPGLTLFQQAVALARNSKLGHGGDSLIYSNYEGFASPVSNGAVYARYVFKKMGYVDEDFDACEDVEFNYRVGKAGLRCFTSPNLAVKYYPRENLGKLFKQMVRYGEGRFLFILKHKEALTISQLVPAGFVLGLLILTLTIFTGNFEHIIAYLLGSLYVFYLIAITIETLLIACGKGWRHRFFLPLIFWIIHFGLGWGFLQQAFSYVGLKYQRQQSK